MSQIELQPGFDFQKAGKDVLEIEREGLAQLDQYINQDFSLACEKIFYCAGKVVVMGMGKSGHIGRKMAATFASTGTSSFFVHPGEAAHGDLGMVTPQDIVIALSNAIAPRSYNAQKMEPYECGIPTRGKSWMQFRVGYYLFAILFLMFEVETVFLFPWAVITRELGVAGLFSVLFFLIILILGLAYAWRKGALEWK